MTNFQGSGAPLNLLSVGILLLVCFIKCISSLDDSLESEWVPFCEEDIFYKPYLRISQGRNGPLIKDRGPGIVDVSNLEDIYVCVNGLVFMYFKITLFHGSIYDDAVMESLPHHCGFFNGKPGPGMPARNTTLYAILLLGHPKDYRKISLQMFTAPSYNPMRKDYLNYTSICIVNSNGECILERGEEKARIRIKGNPPEKVTSKTYSDEEERHTTICRLDIKTLLRDDPTKYPIDTELASREETLNALELNGDDILKFTGCWQYPLIDTKQMKIISDRVEKSSQESFKIDGAKSELNPQDGEGLTFWTKERLEKYGNPLNAPADITQLVSDVDSKNATYQEEASKKGKLRDSEKLKAAKGELDMALLKMNLWAYFTQYQKFFESAKKYGEETKTKWVEVWDLVKTDEVNHTRENYTEIQMQLSSYYHSLRLNPYDIKLLEQIEESEKQKNNIFKKLQDKTWEIGPKITKAEISLFRHSSYKGQASKLMTKIQNMITEYEIHKKGVKNKAHLDTSRDLRESYQDLFLSIKDVQDDRVCIAFLRREDHCKDIKPGGRACKVAKNWLGGLDKAQKTWREEIFQILERIYSKACPYFNDGFVSSINDVVSGYIAQSPGVFVVTAFGGDDTGYRYYPDNTVNLNSTLHNFKINYKYKKWDDFGKPTLKEKDNEIWDQIFKALAQCEQQVIPLEFVRMGANPTKFSFQRVEVPTHVEQADREFDFNWAIDMNYKIFSTVLGVCMNNLQTALAKKFYDEYHSTVFKPILPTWLHNKDNSVFRVIYGRYYVTGKGDLWSNLCMEASFIQSNQQDMRPIRQLFVNSYTEPNYIVYGPLMGTRSAYYVPSEPYPEAQDPNV